MHQVINFARDQLGVKLYPGQAAELEAYYQSGLPNWLLLAGRQSGKSTISDIIACYEAIVPDFSQEARASLDRYILIISQRLDGARVHIRNINKLLKRTAAIRQLIDQVSEDSIKLKNGVIILALPCSARAGRGYTCSTLILDELAHFIDSDGNASGGAVFEALTPTTATFGDQARIVITTTPLSKTGIVFDLYDRIKAGDLEDFYLTQTDTRSMNPKVSERFIKNKYKLDPESAATEYGAEFRDPLENFFSTEAIEACIDPGLARVEEARPGVDYVMAIDPATMKDRYAFLVGHKVQGRVMVDYARVMRPPVDPNQAEALLFDLVERFKPGRVYCDTASTTERLRDKIPQLVYTPFSRPLKLKIYGTLKELINLEKLILYREPDLIDELKALVIKNGVDIAAPKAGKITHDDLADCLALICYGLAEGDGGAVRTVPNPFYGEYEGTNFDRDFIQYPDGTWLHAPRANHRPHPAGITYQNCPYQGRGCQACVNELAAAGYYDLQKQEAEARKQQGTPDYQLMAFNQMQLDQNSKLGEYQHDELRQLFKTTDKRLARFTKRDN